MAQLWYVAITAMLAAYAVLDGFDIGAGIIHLIAARDDGQRRAVLRSIGPVWDGNEVWLIAAGGALFLAFPALYAASFSGFYLPLTIILWLLVLRGISLEFRGRVESLVWAQLWDAVFFAASAALAGFYGAAIGNVVRGVPLDVTGYFFLPLWTDFAAGKDVGILDWFTVMVGLAAFFALAEHGALWVAMKTEDELAERCRWLAGALWWAVILFTALIAALSPLVQPHLLEPVARHPWGYVFPAVAVIGLFGMRHFNRLATEKHAFGCSCLYILGIVASIAFGLFPYVLPSNLDPALGLTIYNASAPARSLTIGMVWLVPGIILATGYMVAAYRSFAGKVKLHEEGEGY
jgi:cytochrome d ubiquinol oxidase subunit II